MTDLLDKAKYIEQGFRDAAINAALHAPPQPPQWVENGEVLCRECGDAIPKARLKVKPSAAFCVNCQSRREAQ